MDRSIVPDLVKVLTHHHHIFRTTDTACTQSKTGMVAYLGGVHTLRVYTVIILLYFRIITSNIHPNLAMQTDRLKSESKDDTNKTPTCAVPGPVMSGVCTKTSWPELGLFPRSHGMGVVPDKSGEG